MTVTFLFWNFNTLKGSRRLIEGELPPERLLASAVARLGVDILVLAECDLTDELILDSFRTEDSYLEPSLNPHPRLRFFTGFPRGQFQPLASDRRIALHRFCPDGIEGLLVVAAHFPDARNYPDERDRASLIEPSLMLLREAEGDHSLPGRSSLGI